MRKRCVKPAGRPLCMLTVEAARMRSKADDTTIFDANLRFSRNNSITRIGPFAEWRVSVSLVEVATVQGSRLIGILAPEYPHKGTYIPV